MAYLEVLTRLAPSPAEYTEVRGVVAQRLAHLVGDPLQWDDLASAAADRLAAPGQDIEDVYRGWLEGVPPEDRIPILRRLMERPEALSLERLQTLVDRWHPLPGTADVQARVLYQLYRQTQLSQSPWPLTQDTRSSPALRLLKAFVVLGRNDLLKAELLLRNCEADHPTIPGPEPLTWDGQWQRLVDAAEHWAEDPRPLQNPPGRLWGLVARLRRGRNDWGEAWLAAVRALVASDDGSRPDAIRLCLDVIAAAPLCPSEFYSEAVSEDILGLPEWGTDVLLALAQRFLCWRGPNPEIAAHLADQLLLNLMNRPGPTEAAWQYWTQVPRLTNDLPTAVSRLRKADAHGGLPSATLACELTELPPEALAHEDDLVWSVSVFIRVCDDTKALAHFDRLTNPDHRGRAVDLFMPRLTHLGPESRWEYLRRWGEEALQAVDMTRLLPAVEHLLCLAEDLPREPVLDLLSAGLRALADRGVISRFGAALGTLNRIGQFHRSASLLRHLIAGRRRLPPEDEPRFDETIAGLTDYAVRRDLRFQLATLLEDEDLPAAVATYTRHWEAELQAGGPAIEVGPLLDRLRHLVKTPQGEHFGPLLLLAGRVACRSDMDTAISFLATAAVYGEASAAFAVVAELVKETDGPAGCKALFLLLQARLESQSGQSHFATIQRLLETLEDMPGSDEASLAKWKPRVEWVLKDSGSGRPSVPTDVETRLWHARLLAWAHDLGRPNPRSWGIEVTGVTRAYETLLELLPDAPTEWLDWLAERLLPRAEGLPGSLALDLLRTLVADRSPARPDQSRYLVEKLRERWYAAPGDIELEMLRQALMSYCEQWQRPVGEPRFWLMETHLLAHDCPAAVSQARQYLAETGSSAACVLRRFVECDWLFIPARTADLDLGWELVLDLAGRVSEDDNLPWQDHGLTALRLLTHLDRIGPERLRKVETFRECLGQHARVTAEAELAIAVLRLLGGDFPNALEAFKTVQCNPEALDRQVPHDPLAARQVTRPEGPEGWDEALLALVDQLSKDCRAEQGLARPSRSHYIGNRAASPPALLALNELPPAPVRPSV